MGCHKCSAMTSFQDRVQGEDRQQRRDIRLFQALMTAHCKPPLFEQTRRGGGGLNWTESSLRLLGWEMKVVIMIIPCWKAIVKEKQLVCCYLCLSYMFSICCKSYILCTRIKLIVLFLFLFIRTK